MSGIEFGISLPFYFLSSRNKWEIFPSYAHADRLWRFVTVPRDAPLNSVAFDVRRRAAAANALLVASQRRLAVQYLIS